MPLWIGSAVLTGLGWIIAVIDAMASADTAASAETRASAEPPESGVQSLQSGEPVSPSELNAWRRGFTPQAEIWNGRLAMVGLSVGLTVLLIARLAGR